MSGNVESQSQSPSGTARGAQSPLLVGSLDPDEGPRRSRLRGVLLVTAWAVSTTVIGAVILASRTIGPESVTRALVALLLGGASTAALVYWLGRVPAERLPGAEGVTRRWYLAGLIAVAALVLFPAGLAGPVVLVPLTAVAVVVLIWLRGEVGRREVGWSLLLGVVAAVAGVAAGVATGSGGEIVAGALQLPLVLVNLLAGWALARRSGWVPRRIGPSAVVSAGWRPALRLVAVAFVLALPWGLGNIVNGPLEIDRVTSGWQALALAVQPGVAEEAWGRVFLIAALYVLFRRAARSGTALMAAAVLATLWFAFVHTPADPVSAVLLAAVYTLPITWLFLRRGLEAAIGFHICVDLIRFGAAYLAFQGLWFT